MCRMWPFCNLDDLVHQFKILGIICAETWHFTFSCWTRSKFSNIRESECNPGFAAAAVHQTFILVWNFHKLLQHLGSVQRSNMIDQRNGRSQRPASILDFSYLGRAPSFRKEETFIQTWFIVISPLLLCVCRWTVSQDDKLWRNKPSFFRCDSTWRWCHFFPSLTTKWCNLVPILATRWRYLH